MQTLEIESKLTVQAPQELTSSTIASFREEVQESLIPETTSLSVDLRLTTFVDSSGLGALISLHKTMKARGGKVRLLNPRQSVLQIIELTRMHRLFEISRA